MGVPRFTPSSLDDPKQLFKILQSLSSSVERQEQVIADLQQQLRRTTAPATSSSRSQQPVVVMDQITLEAIREALEVNGVVPLSIDGLRGIASQSQRGYALTATSASGLPDPAVLEVGTMGAVLSGGTLTFYMVQDGSPHTWLAQTTLSVAVVDSTFTIQDDADATKKARFECSGISAGATRVFTFPNYNATLATLAGAETLTNKTLTLPVIGDFSNAGHNHSGSVQGGQITVAAHSDYGFGNQPFNAGDFTAQVGNWTVAAGDVTTYAYLRLGGIFIVWFDIRTTDVSSTPTYLQLVLPDSRTAAIAVRGVYWYLDAGAAAWAQGLWQATGTALRLFKDPNSTLWTTTAGGNTYVQGVAILRV